MTVFQDLQNILKKTGLTHLYPGHISRENFFELTELSCFSDKNTKVESISELSQIFIQNLRFHYGSARSLEVYKAQFSYSERKMYTDQPENIHPLEIIIAVFLCCDPIAKQDFVRLLWECKFAIPFVLQTDDNKIPTLFFWPLRSIFFSSLNNDPISAERIPKCSNAVVSFIRLGETTISKSDIINTVICQSENQHSTFFHRDLKGSVEIKSTPINGMIEVSFASLPQLCDCMLLNLRGDIRQHIPQANFIYALTQVYVIICGIRELDEVDAIYEGITDIYLKPGFLLILTDTKIDDDCDKKIESFLTKHSTFETDFIALGNTPKSNMTENFNNFIKKLQPKCRNVEKICTSVNEHVKVDESNNVFIESMQLVKKVVHIFQKKTYEDMLPLHGKYYEDWCIANAKLYKLEDDEMLEGKKTLECQRKECRVSQMQLITSKRLFVKYFVELYYQTKHNVLLRQICFRLIQFELKDLTNETASRLQNEFRDARSLFKLSSETEKRKVEKLLGIQKKLSKSAIGFTNITKELGQAYEASLETEHATIFEHPLQCLPEIAIQTLLDGYPLEIVDGNSLSVSIKWISAVLNALHEHLKEKHKKKNIKVKVISILGIQGSGKSTLLNIMFGANFEVSSGRCTLGLHLYLVKVKYGSKWADLSDYILLIDSEGLCAIEQCANIHKERELATFIIGLASLTIINIMNEDTLYLRDILPIAAHAFLRIDLIGLDPRCIIVHQNVDNMNKHLLLKQWSDLERQLDEHTRAACALEKVTDMRFRDVVRFDISRDIHCLPSFLQRYETIEMTSNGYSKGAMTILHYILTEKDGKASDMKHIKNFTILFSEAIKEDNFVYEFKNTIEAELKTTIDRKWCISTWKLRELPQIFLSNFKHEQQSIKTVKECEQIYESYVCEIHTSIEEKLSNMYAEFKDIIQLESEKYSILTEHLKKYKMRLVKEKNTLCKSVTKSAIKYLTKERDKKIREIKMLVNDVETEQEVVEFITVISNLKTDQQTSKNIHQSWINSLAFEPDREISRDQMTSIALRTLFEAYPSHKRMVAYKTKVFASFRQGSSDKQNHQFQLPSEINNDLDATMSLVAKNTVDDIIDKVNTLLQERKSKRKTFDDNVFAQIILELLSNKQIKRHRFTKHRSFEIDLCIYVIEMSIIKLVDIEKHLFTREATVNTQERTMFDLILKQIMFYNKDLVDNMYKGIQYGLYKSLIPLVVTYITYELVRFQMHDVNILMSKQAFRLYVILQMANENTFQCIRDYLRNPCATTHFWLCSIFDDFISGNDNDSVQWQNIRRFIHVETTDMLTKIRDTIQRMEYVDLDQWEGTLYRNLRSIMPMVDIVDGTQPKYKSLSFIKESITMKSATLEEVLNVNATDIFEKYYDDIKIEVVNSLEYMLYGQNVKCPQCSKVRNDASSQIVLSYKPSIPIPREFLQRYTINQDVQLLSSEFSDAFENRNQQLCNQGSIFAENESFCKFVLVTFYEDIFKDIDANKRPYFPEPWKYLNLKTEKYKILLELQRTGQQMHIIYL